jgi:ribosomal protein S18 acetylase RimI-like enzyme
MWLDPCSRGLGVGRRLLESLEALARENGVRVLHLETNRALEEAIEMYRTAGSHHWFEKTLTPQTSRS